MPHVATFTALIDLPTFGTNRAFRSIVKGFRLSGIYRIQSGAVQNALVGGINLNGDGNGNNERPALYNPNAPANSVAIRIGSGYVDANDNPINLANAQYVVDPAIRTGIIGRNTLRGPIFSQLDMSLQRTFTLTILGLETARLNLRFDLFNVLNHPSFAPGPGNVLDPTFNNPYVDGEGTNRTGRIQLRFSF